METTYLSHFSLKAMRVLAGSPSISGRLQWDEVSGMRRGRKMLFGDSTRDVWKKNSGDVCSK